jgi:cytochrome c55X
MKKILLPLLALGGALALQPAFAQDGEALFAMTVARHAVSRLGLALASFLLIPTALAAAPTAERQAKLDHLLLQDCGSCHGLRMTGGLGPALTREALAGKPRDSLIATVTHGRPGTAMPGWNALLDEQDIAYLVDRLLEGYPKP